MLSQNPPALMSTCYEDPYVQTPSGLMFFAPEVVKRGDHFDPIGLLEPPRTESCLQQLEHMRLPPISPINFASAPENPQPQLLEPVVEGSASKASLVMQLRDMMPVPPLRNFRVALQAPKARQCRPRRPRSKYDTFQDGMFLKLKREGYSWAEIAQLVGIDSPIAVRNRYQVIIGQQGNNNSLNWTSRHEASLRELIDLAEVDKWQYVAHEMSRCSRKPYSVQECQEFVRHTLEVNPRLFGWSQSNVLELQRCRGDRR